MRLIIAGGRDYAFTELDIERLNEIRLFHGVTEVVSGNSGKTLPSGQLVGADRHGEQWADRHAIPTAVFPVSPGMWSAQGGSAGPRRNARMASYAAGDGKGAVALFPGGRGTESMLKYAKIAGLEIYDFRSQDNG